MVYGQGTNSGTIYSPLSFSQTINWFTQQGYVNHLVDFFDYLHEYQLDLRDANSVCSAHIDIDKRTGRSPGQPTTGTFHMDTFNPYVPIIPRAWALQIYIHYYADVDKQVPSSKLCH